jgi:hypothetical protein
VFPPLVRLHSLVEDIDDDIGKRRDSDYAGLLRQGGGSLTSPSWRPGARGDEPGSEGSRVAEEAPLLAGLPQFPQPELPVLRGSAQHGADLGAPAVDADEQLRELLHRMR